jgi:hypothetical protein
MRGFRKPENRGKYSGLAPFMNNELELQIERCKAETLEHIKKVGENINVFIKELIYRAEIHDDSKLQSPELEGYATIGTKLRDIEYGSEAYKKNLELLKPVIEHHYSVNRHHTEFWPQGINDMTLIDVLELLADWKAATLRNKNGNLRKSIEINAEKYNISPQLKRILENTVRECFPD